MGGDQFDKRWYILGGFAVLAIAIVGVILISRGGGDSSGEEAKTTASKEKAEAGGKGAKGCTEVEQPEPREESLSKPKMTTKKGEKVTAVVKTNCGTFDIALATTEALTIANSFAYLAEEGFYDELTGKTYLDAAAFPAITFKSTKVETTGSNTANVTGDLTLHGVTKPVVLAVTFNGGWAANAYDGARIGFSAKGALKRTDFGIGSGVPAPGTNMGVGDRIEVAIESEFSSGKPTGPTPPH